MLEVDKWKFQYPKLDIEGKFKAAEHEFQVTEILGYEPIGEGEHIYLWIEKTGLNTAYLAEKIAQFVGLPLRAVTYAGRKDKHAKTYQWFGVHLPGKTEVDWQRLDVPGAKVLRASRHNKKLRTGVLKGNTFNITVRDLTGTDGIVQRCETIAEQGVPNYFGQQRFGDTRHDERGGNLSLAEKMINGENIRNRNKRSMTISALRSWLFNQYISERLSALPDYTPMTGDVMQLAGNKSFFNANLIDQTINHRLSTQDIYLTAPMWGEGPLDSELDALSFESDVSNKHRSVTQTLNALGLKQERRAIRLFPKDFIWTLDGQTLNLTFSLPAGTFATSVLREIVQVSQSTQANL